MKNDPRQRSKQHKRRSLSKQQLVSIQCRGEARVLSEIQNIATSTHVFSPIAKACIKTSNGYRLSTSLSPRTLLPLQVIIMLIVIH